MKFMHNYISTKTNQHTLSDIIKAAQTKVAMASAPVAKTAQAEEKSAANLDNFGDKKAKPFGAKDKDDKDVVEVEIEEKEGCNTGGKGKDKDKKPAKASAAKPVKKAEAEEAESSGQLEEKANPQNNPQSDEKSSKGGKANNDEAESSGQLEEKANPQNNPEVKKDAVSIKKWILLANLTKEQKNFVREELEKFWTKKFVDALLEDR